jgi:hypothetical protein
MIARKAAPARRGLHVHRQAGGPDTPSALAMAELAARAGVPAGVFNVITGGARDIGAELTSNPLVRKLTFTGSTEVGRVLMAQSAPTLKKLSMELGGNAPFIVFADADLDAAVQGALTSKYRNTGQTCVCANRLLVQQEVYDEFAGRLRKAVSALKIGDGLKGPTDLGPLIDAAALAKVQEHIADARAKGGQITLGGKPHALGGTFFEATIVTEATSAMKFAREETFGPVAPLFRFRDEAEAVRMANDTEFGLASYMYTRDLARACGRGARVRIVGINTGLISTEVALFRCHNRALAARSHHGILDYTELKYPASRASRPLKTAQPMLGVRTVNTGLPRHPRRGSQANSSGASSATGGSSAAALVVAALLYGLVLPLRAPRRRLPACLDGRRFAAGGPLRRLRTALEIELTLASGRSHSRSAFLTPELQVRGPEPGRGCAGDRRPAALPAAAAPHRAVRPGPGWSAGASSPRCIFSSSIMTLMAMCARSPTACANIGSATVARHTC